MSYYRTTCSQCCSCTRVWCRAGLRWVSPHPPPHGRRRRWHPPAPSTSSRPAAPCCCCGRCRQEPAWATTRLLTTTTTRGLLIFTILDLKLSDKKDWIRPCTGTFWLEFFFFRFQRIFTKKIIILPPKNSWQLLISIQFYFFRGKILELQNPFKKVPVRTKEQLLYSKRRKVSFPLTGKGNEWS